MPPVDQDRDLAKLTRLRVLELDSTPQAKCLQLRWAYYQQAQHDGLGYDFDGRNRPSNISYEEQRLRSLGWISVENATNPAGPPAAVTFGARRPDCPTTIAGYVVDTYTSMLLGEGREPAVRVVGDADSTAALNAMLDAGYAWDALQEVRKIAGAVGAAAILPEIINGELSFRALRPEDLYVEWDTSRDWVPRLVIEQRRVEVTGLDDDGQLTSSKVWRTRAWDQTYAYVYQDVPLDHGKAPPTGGPSQRGRASDEDSIELAEAPIAHKAGRCPVIWLQNTRCSDEPIGEADCGNVFELIDRLDRFESMILRGGTANLDPTLVISDKLVERRMQERRAKGYGQKIEVSESGKVHLLEMTGKTIEVAIVIADRIRHKIEMRTGVLVIQPDQAGAVASSGVALQLLRGTANNRVSARRPSLSRTIKQLGEVLLELAREWGIKLLGTDGPGIALPPREVPATETDVPASTTGDTGTPPATSTTEPPDPTETSGPPPATTEPGSGKRGTAANVAAPSGESTNTSAPYRATSNERSTPLRDNTTRVGSVVTTVTWSQSGRSTPSRVNRYRTRCSVPAARSLVRARVLLSLICRRRSLTESALRKASS